MRMDNGQAYRQASQVLPLSLRGEALDLPEDKQGRAEELRLRIGHPMTAVCFHRENCLWGQTR